MAVADTRHQKGANAKRHDLVDESIGFNQGDHDKSIAKGGVTTPFPWKLHDMLDDMDRRGTQSIVCWQPHGRSFMVLKPKEFVEDIMPHYFNQTKYASFQRQLNLYGFSRLSHGRDKGAYYHSCFVRGESDLCRGMIRQKIKGTKVRRSLAPEEEPNFYLPEYNPNAVSQVPQPVSSMVRSKALHIPPLLKSAPVDQDQDPAPKSLVSLMKMKTQRAPVHALSPPPMITIKHMHAPQTVPSPLRQQSRLTYSQDPLASFQSKTTPSSTNAKGGDLLYFEGLPFRYLEHIEELPPLLPPNRNPSYKETLHEMISSIVNMEKSWTKQNFNACTV